MPSAFSPVARERRPEAGRTVGAKAPRTSAENPVALLFRELSRCRGAMPERLRWRIAGVIHDQSRRFGYDPLFVLAIVEVESTCSPTARGAKGGVGLIQVMPTTARAVAEDAGLRWSGPAALTYPSVNVRVGLHYLWTLEKRFNDPRLALTAYNAGPARVSRMSQSQARRSRYVRRVLLRYEKLLELRK
jgi:soluble lytic murein transglycosylase